MEPEELPDWERLLAAERHLQSLVSALEQVRSVCLYVATKLADLRDEWVIIGGLVPSLLIDQRRLD